MAILPDPPAQPVADPSGDYARAQAWAMLKAKYQDSGNWAIWAATLLRENIADLKNKSGEDVVTSELQNLLSLIDNMPSYSPGNITGYVAPDAPTYIDLPTYNAPTIGTLRDIPTPADVDMPDAPTYLNLPTYNAPTIGTLRDIPTPADVDMPDAPTYLNLPTYTAPTMGTLRDIPAPADLTAPDAPTYLSLPTYTAPTMGTLVDLPDIPDLTIPAAPDTALTFSETPFSDALLNDLKSRISSDLAGLGSYEAAMFKRHEERVLDERTKAMAEVTSQFSARGFDMPPGAWLAKETEMVNESSKRLTDVSADIMSTAARESLNTAMQIVDLMGRLNDSKMMRAFEAQKTAVQLAVEGFKATISGLEAQAGISKAIIDASVATNEGVIKTFLGEIEGQTAPMKAIAEVNKAIASGYTAAVSGLEAQGRLEKTAIDAAVAANEGVIKAYLGEIEGQTAPMKAIAEVNKAITAGYSAAVEGADVQGRLEKASVDAAIAANEGMIKAYLGEIEGQTAPLKTIAEVNKAITAGYSAEVERADVQGKLEKTAIDAVVAANEGVIKAFLGEIEGQTTPMKAIAEVNKAMASGYAAAVEGAGASVRASAIPEDLKIKQAELAAKQVEIKSGVAAKAAEISIETALRKMQTEVATLQGLAQSASQMIASSLGTVNSSTSFGFSGSASTHYTST